MTNTRRNIYLVLILLVGAILLYRYLWRSPALFQAVPAQSALVLECNGLLKAQQLLQSLPTPEWEALGRSALFQTGFNDASAAFELFRQQPELLRNLAKSPALMAYTLHPADSLHPLFLVQLPEAIDLDKWLTNNKIATRHLFHNQNIWRMPAGNKQYLEIAASNEFLIFSAQAALVESALAQLEQGNHWWTERPLADDLPHTPLRLHLRPSVCAEQLRARLHASWQHLPDLAAQSIEWIGWTWDGASLDCLLEPAGFGRSWTGSSGSASYAPDMLLPDHVAFVLKTGIQRKNSFFEALEQPLNPDFNKYVLPWTGNEAILAVTEPLSERLRTDRLWLLAVRDSALAIQQLRAYGATHGLIPDASRPYQMFELMGFQQGGLLEPFAGKDEAFRNPVCTMLEGYVVFAPDRASMEVFLDKYLVGKTLGAREDYLALLNKQAETGHLELLLNTRFMQALFSSLGQWQVEEFWASPGWLRASVTPEGSGKARVRWSNQAAEASGQAAEMLWKTPLPALVASQPWVAALRPGKDAVLVQDRQHRLYCLNAADGQLWWTRQFSGPLLSEPQVVDYFRSGYPCLMFNTASAVFLLDEKGHDVQGFPFLLPEKTDLPITVVDFGGDQVYSFFALCQNGKVYGFDPLNRPFPGWNGLALGSPAAAPLCHFQYDGKDFLAVLTRQGSLWVFGRDGKPRFPALSLPGPYSTPLWVDSKAAVPHLYAANKAGQVFECDPEGVLYTLETGFAGTILRFGQWRADKPVEWLQWNGQQLRTGQIARHGIQVQALKKLADKPTNWFIPQEQGIGAVDTLGRRLWLFDDYGKPKPGFPLGGATPFTLFQRGSIRMLVTANDQEVWVYRLR
ncbi:MAG TPA: hypothetical protein VK168_06150 [Saprospiraceae bacterium]|nr:hypothetical protein [Saprospiraceae bacterium]